MAHYVPLPDAVAESFPAGRSVRVVGTLAGVPFRRTLQRQASGETWLRFGRSWLRDAGIAVGEVVAVELGLDPDPDRVDLPPELEAVLAQDAEAAEAWAALTPGKQRTMAYGIGRGKAADTRERRALKVARDVLDQSRRR